MQIFIKSASYGNIITLDVASTDTIWNIKCKISTRAGVPSDAQRLIYSGKQLRDGHTLVDYCIGRESTVILVRRLCGGMYHGTSGRNGGYGPYSIWYDGESSDEEDQEKNEEKDDAKDKIEDKEENEDNNTSRT